MATISDPWQNGPTELIEFALSNLHQPDDFHQRIAFLLLDVGVETLFKTYLTLNEEITGAKLSHPERQRAAEGNFHELCRGIKGAAGERLRDIKISHIEFYHDLRNKLYHEGNGITIPTDKAHGYASLAVDLLNRLLAVDLDEELRKPAVEAARAAEEKAKREREELELGKQVEAVRAARQKVAEVAAVAVERVYPPLVLPSFTSMFQAFWEQENIISVDGEKLDLLTGKVSDSTKNHVYGCIGELGKRGVLNPFVGSRGPVDFYLDILGSLIDLAGDGRLSYSHYWRDEYRYSEDFPKEPEDLAYWDDYLNEEPKYSFQLRGQPQVEAPTHAEVLGLGRAWVKKLNNISDTIELWMAAGCPMPGVEAPAKREHKGSPVTGKEELYQEFFADLLGRLRTARPGATRAGKVSPANWFWFSAGRPNFYLGWSFGRGDVLRVELTIGSNDKAANGRAFEALERQKDEIELELETTLIWEPRPNNVQKLIRVTRPAKITDDPKELESAKQWATSTMVKFIDILTPRIRKLDF